MAKMIERCGECGFYSWKKHRCTRGATQESDPKAPYYDDCPLPDAEPVRRGRWIPLGQIAEAPFVNNYRCSECDYRVHFRTRYCPDCGKPMDGGGGNEG